MRIPDFSNISIFVVGDVMLDRYWKGSTDRISPEAPVPVVLKKNREDRLGGAANVALNLSALQIDTELGGLIGKDSEGAVIDQLLVSAGIKNSSIRSENFSSITKLRVMSRNQQLLRIDTEESIPHELQAKVLGQSIPCLKNKQALIISDYAKGTYPDPQPLIKAARKAGIPVLIDPKGSNYEKYRNTTLITPNMSEFQAVVGHCENEQDVFKKAEQLRANLELDAVVVTMSERGIAIIEKEAKPIRIPTKARDVYDVTGAGDTVIALLAACIGSGRPLTESVQIANLGAGIVVGKLGTAFCNREELEASLYEHQASASKSIVTEEELLALVANAKEKGERIVMTNGCFDLLHPGHLAYLQEAASEGDRLIVAVNDDQSVKNLKGSSRPINKLEDRMAMLSGLKGVDWVCPFSEETPKRLISEVLPDLLIKGGDYEAEEIVGYKEVTEAGGSVKILSFLKGYSSSSLIERIREKK